MHNARPSARPSARCDAAFLPRGGGAGRGPTLILDSPRGNAGVAGFFTRCDGVHTIFAVDWKFLHCVDAALFCCAKR